VSLALACGKKHGGSYVCPKVYSVHAVEKEDWTSGCAWQEKMRSSVPVKVGGGTFNVSCLEGEGGSQGRGGEGDKIAEEKNC